MPKFRKKPVEIEAHKWLQNGDHPKDFSDRDGGHLGDEMLEGLLVRYYPHPDVPGTEVCQQCSRTMHFHGWIDTLEGGHVVCPGDWIITGIQGEHYPCKADIFAKTYDAL